tara:strand:+ start:46107 stop:47309 length:1203 start_codon:yes stop_codon:yes gene_type:complete
MLSGSSKKLVILDPGLKGLSGHHVAVLDTLSALRDKLSIQVWCNNTASEGVLDKVANLGFTAKLFFSSEFYGYLFEPASLAKLAPQLNQLVAEYCRALVDIGSDNQTTILMHTLDWYHLWAFSLAMQQYERKHGVLLSEISLMLMFNPLGDSGQDLCVTPIYSSACRNLLKHTNITFYAADYEIAHDVSSLLELDEILPIHPCVVTSVDPHQLQQLKREQGDYLLLYCGDAKANKGFNALPQLLAQCLSVKNSSTQYVIHYTNLSDDPQLSETETELELFAGQDSRVVIKKGFLDDIKINKLIANCRALILNYDSQVYQNKTSGIIWLAARYNTPLLLNTQSWLEREAKRLGLPHCQLTNESLVNIGSSIKACGLSGRDSQYKQQLFASFSDWLLDRVLK